MIGVGSNTPLFNIFTACGLYLVLLAVTPFLASYYNAPVMRTLAPVLFLLVPVNSFSNIQNTILTRRFDFKIKTDRLVFLSDYAHHPAEIAQSVKSIRELYRDKKITAIFQPHLYTRTRDFYKDFADSLSLLDEVILTEIYPAREQPIPGVSSQLIYDNLRPGIEKCICRKEDIPELLSKKPVEVLIVLGAGDLDNYVPSIARLLEQRSKA